jgi:hypothetical protein
MYAHIWRCLSTPGGISPGDQVSRVMKTTVKTLILRRIIRLSVLALNYWCSTSCQNIGVGKFALELVLLRYASAGARTGRV